MPTDTINEEKIIFKSNITVLVNHLNYGNHLGYDSVLSIVQEVRIRFLKELQLSEVSIEGGIGYLVTNVNVDYKQESLHGDELLVKLSLNKLNSLSMELYSTIENNTTKKIVAVCTTKHLFYDYKKRKIAKVSDTTLNLLRNGIQ